VSKDMDAGSWCHASDVLGESRGRQIDQIGALGEADGPPGSPVDGDGTIWVNAADQLCCLLGVEMALTKARSPASDWHKGDVDECRLLKTYVRACVPRIPAPAGAGNKEAECRSAMRAPRVSAAIVIGGEDAYRQAAKLHRVARLDFAELQTAGGNWLEQAPRACRGDENRRGWD
jgi:hypothetical protein